MNLRPIVAAAAPEVLDQTACDLYYSRMVIDPALLQRQASFLNRLSDAEGFVELFRHLDHVHFYLKNREGEFMAANRPSILRNGIREESEIIGRTDFDFHPPELAEAYRAEDRMVMDSGKPLADQVWLVYDFLKVQQWFLSTKVPLRDSQGQVIGVAGAMRTLDSVGPGSRYAEFSAAVNLVLRHYDQKLQVPDLAELTGLSVSQFNRSFRRAFSMSPSQYILRVRVNAARNLLSTTTHSVADIACRTGFYDQAQLARYFKRITGMTPSQYRKQFRVFAAPL